VCCARYDKDAGIFNYGFDAATFRPWAFYMTGVPWVASWLWQPFGALTEASPSEDVWSIPDACADAKPCPGWRP
jgi:hypothetical protein